MGKKNGTTGRKAKEGPSHRRLKPEVRREQIMWSAVKLFSQDGFERTTTKQIAAAAGISEGTIYKYYRSKKEILFSFLKSEALESLSSLMQEMDAAGGEEVIRKLFANRFELFRRHRKLLKVLFGEAFFNPGLAEAIRKKLALPVLCILEEYFKDGMKKGIFRPVGPGIAARALMGHFFAFVVWTVIFGEDGGEAYDPGLAENLAGLFVNGIKFEAGLEKGTA